MQGICIKDSASSNLVVGQQYYLFEHSKTHYYASLFAHFGSFFGIYRKTLFKITETTDELPAIIPAPAKHADLKENALYSATMISDYGEKLRPIRRKGDRFYLKVRPGLTHAIYYADPQMKQLIGCTPLDNFDSFAPHDGTIPLRTVEEVSAEMHMFMELDDYDARNALVQEYRQAFELKEKVKTEPGQEQLSLF